MTDWTSRPDESSERESLASVLEDVAAQLRDPELVEEELADVADELHAHADDVAALTLGADDGGVDEEDDDEDA